MSAGERNKLLEDAGETPGQRMTSPYLTIKEAAAYLRVDEKTLRRHVMPVIEPLSIGSRKFYTKEMLDSWHDRARAESSESSSEHASRTRYARRDAALSPRGREILAKLHGELKTRKGR